MRCRVVTWNIHSCVGSDGRYDVGRVAEVLAGLEADIIGLQEVDWRRPAEGGGEAFEFIAAQLGMNAVEGPNLHDHAGRYGNGLLTRFDVTQVRQWSLACDGREPRGAIDATLTHRGFTIRTWVTHLGLKFRERRKQVDTLRKAIASGAPTNAQLLLGDMNEWRTRVLMRRAFLPGPFVRMVTGRTFPSTFPCLPLDGIFLAPQPLSLTGGCVRMGSARVASDHLPLFADIEWTPAPG